jgi:hypothetical protein
VIHLKADAERRCVLIYLDSHRLPVLSKTLGKFLQAISHKVRPYRPEPNEDLTGFDVLFVRIPPSKTIEETLQLQERTIQSFMRELRADLDSALTTPIRVESCPDPLVLGQLEAAPRS